MGPKSESALGRSDCPWFGPGRFTLWLAIAVAAAFPGVLVGVESFGYRDFGTFTYPLAYYHRESFWRGELPFWNPLNNCGLPFLAQWNSLTLYPPALLYLLLPLPWSLNVFCLGHLVLAGLGMYHLARRWSGDPLGASVAGMAYALNGLSLSALMWTSVTAALGWMPWMVLWGERAWREGGRRVIVAGGVGAIQMLTGAPEVIVLTWSLVAAMAGVALVQRQVPRARLLLRLGGVALIVTGLSAPQLLPFLDLVAHSDRTPQFAASQDLVAQWWTMPYWGWANLLVPMFRCQLTPLGTYVHSVESWVASFYCGSGVLALALVAGTCVPRRRGQFLMVAAVVAWGLALGPKAGLYDGLRWLFPPVGLMRYPAKFIVLSLFAIPLLAAGAVAHLQGLTGAARRSAGRSLAAVGGGLLMLIGGIMAWSLWLPVTGEDWGTTLRSGLQSAVLLGAVLAALFYYTRVEQPLQKRLLGLGVLAVVAWDACTHMPNLTPTVGSRALEPGVVTLDPRPGPGETRAMASLEAVRAASRNPQPSVFQHLALERLGLLYSCNLLEGLPMVGGFFPLYLREPAVVEAWLGEKFPTRLADFLGVAQVTAPKTMTTWQARSTALPLATAGQQPLFDSPTNTIRALVRDDFDPRRVVYLPPEARAHVTATNATEARVTMRRFSAQRIELEVEAREPAWVVLAQAYYHPWRAFVDDRPAVLWRANHAYQAVEVPAGQHRLRLVYRDRRFFAGMAWAALTLTACVALWRRRAAPRTA